MFSQRLCEFTRQSIFATLSSAQRRVVGSRGGFLLLLWHLCCMYFLSCATYSSRSSSDSETKLVFYDKLKAIQIDEPVWIHAEKLTIERTKKRSKKEEELKCNVYNMLNNSLYVFLSVYCCIWTARSCSSKGSRPILLAACKVVAQVALRLPV